MPYADPNKHLPGGQPRWKDLLKRLSKKDPSCKLPKPTVPLTTRNLTEYFNPDYNDEHDAFHQVRGPRKISIPEWIDRSSA